MPPKIHEIKRILNAKLHIYGAIMGGKVTNLIKPMKVMLHLDIIEDNEKEFIEQVEILAKRYAYHGNEKMGM